MGTKLAGDECLARVGEDEPFFVLRAHDASAIGTVMFWLDSNRQIGDEKRAEVIAEVRAMQEWQREHGTKTAD